MNQPTLSDSQIFALDRPAPRLLQYYGLVSLLAGPFFFVLLIPLWIRYLTLRFRFDDEGVSLHWGKLFRREIHLSYARIQDIHLVSNAVERWLGLARIQIQTASGSAKAEMTIEGVESYEALRDFLYSRMRGARGEPPKLAGATGNAGPPASNLSEATTAELGATLRQVAEELRELRLALEENSRERGDA